jgi:hypothetical protein
VLTPGELLDAAKPGEPFDDTYTGELLAMAQTWELEAPPEVREAGAALLRRFAAEFAVIEAPLI